ncbi:hypothetical protein [Shewanella surugensis]|uniref:Uncharacterized protein n=1 Tax=Shewanella surugensis TaxID=212020 RepID=A0ABT0LJH2_9GAMM|nr:hypothetical protein [Shewanella surugensis]MCL1127861.1 hypothetical protein [Shewanella surugensis]
MRLMLRFTIPVERENQPQADDSLFKVLKLLVEQLNPEAADQAQLAIVNESLFEHCHAAIDIQPVLNLDDLMKAL